MEVNFKFKINNAIFKSAFNMSEEDYKQFCKEPKSEQERLVKIELAKQHIEIIEMQSEE